MLKTQIYEWPANFEDIYSGNSDDFKSINVLMKH